MRKVLASPAAAVVFLLIGLVFEAAVAATPSSPLQPVLAPGGGPSGPFAGLARALGLTGVHGNALVAVSVVALVLSAAAFLWFLRMAWRGGFSLRMVLVLAVAANIAVLSLPLLASRDVYSYIGYGNIVSLHHANPYVQTPADFPGDAIAQLVGPKWFGTPAVYGPAFSALSGVLTRMVHGVSGQVAAFRILAAAASLGTVALIASTARRVRPDLAVFAVAAFGLNPVVLFQSVASGHNDLFVAVAVVAAFAFVLRGKELPAVAVLTLGALVKATGGIPLILLLVWCVARRPSGERLRAAAGRIGLAAAITLVFAIPFFQLHDPSLGMVELAGHQGWLAPSRLIARIAEAVGGGGLSGVVRAVFAAGLLVMTALLGRHVARAAVASAEADTQTGGPSARVPTTQLAAQVRPTAELGAAWGWSLLFLMLLGPVLLPWYVTWALPVVWLLPRVPRIALLGVSTALSVSQFTAEPGLYPPAYNANILVGHYVIAPVVAGGLLWLLLDAVRRLRRRTDLSATGERQPVAAPAGEH